MRLAKRKKHKLEIKYDLEPVYQWLSSYNLHRANVTAHFSLVVLILPDARCKFSAEHPIILYRSILALMNAIRRLIEPRDTFIQCSEQKNSEKKLNIDGACIFHAAEPYC